MAWFKGLMGGMAGAFGYSHVSQYETKDIAQGLLGILARDGGSGAKTTVVATRVDPQMNELTKQLRDLQMQLHANRAQPLTIVTGQSSKGYSYIIVPSSIAGIVLLYLRYVKGWRIMDFMYVTRASLQGLKSSVAEMQKGLSAGINKMQEDMNAKTRVLAQHLGLVNQKQDDLLTQQQQLDGKLEDLGEQVDGKITHLHTDVRGIQNEMGEIHNKVNVSTTGMYVLCRAIADMCRAIDFNGKSVAAIDTYLQAAGGAIMPPPGQAGGAQQGGAQEAAAARIEAAPVLPALLPPGVQLPTNLASLGPEFESLQALITEEPTAAPSASVAPAPASGAPSTSTQGQASTTRNARSKSNPAEATDARSYFGSFLSMGRHPANARTTSLPAVQPQ